MVGMGEIGAEGVGAEHSRETTRHRKTGEELVNGRGGKTEESQVQPQSRAGEMAR